MKKTIAVLALAAIMFLGPAVEAADEVAVTFTLTLTQTEIAAMCSYYGRTENGVVVPVTAREARSRLIEENERRIARIAERYVSDLAVKESVASGALVIGR